MKMKTVLCCAHWIIRIWRIDGMYKQTMNTAKGIGLGVLTGVTVAAISAKAMNGGHHRAAKLKKNAGRVIHTMGDLIGDVEKML